MVGTESIFNGKSHQVSADESPTVCAGGSVIACTHVGWSDGWVALCIPHRVLGGGIENKGNTDNYKRCPTYYLISLGVFIKVSAKRQVLCGIFITFRSCIVARR